MHIYEFQVLVALLVVNFLEVLDSVTTWFGMRSSGKPFEAIEKNPCMRKLGFKRSTILSLSVVFLGTVIFFLLSLWLFQSLIFAEVLLPFAWIALCLAKFEAAVNNFREIRKLNKEKKKV